MLGVTLSTPIAVAPLQYCIYDTVMPNEKVWIRVQERKQRIQKRRNDLIVSLARDGVPYGEIAEIVRVDKSSISRLMKYGKNISKSVPAS